MMIKLSTLALAGLMAVVPVVASAGPGGGDPAQFQAIEAEVFAQADANGDGVLDEAEFAQFHELMRERMEAKHFARIDADGSGGITLQELQAARPPHGGRGGGGD